MKPATAKLLKVGMAVVAVASIVLYFVMKGRGESVVGPEKEVTVKRGDIEITILATGTVQPENRVEIKPPINGRVERVLVSEGAKVRRGQVLAWMSSTERAALIDAARAKGKGELAQWEEMYKPTPILAPITGTLIQRNVESGQGFTSSDPVFVMSDRLTVKAQVDETDIAKIKSKQKATIVLDAYSEQKLPATVDQIAFDAKTVNNVTTYDVDVLPDATPDFMRSGMTANVTFDIDVKRDILRIPNEAIKYVDGKPTVKIKKEGKPVEQTIETGITDGRHVEVVSGLNESQAILVPQYRSEGGGKKGAGSPLNPRAPGRGRAH